MEGGATTMSTERTVVVGTGYVKTVEGILKIVEIVLSLIVFICAVIYGWNGMGFVSFVGISAFISVLIILIFHLVGLYGKAAGPWLLVEFIFYIVFCVLFLIAAIISCVYAAQWGGRYRGPPGAAAFFSFAALAVFAVDTFFQFRTWNFSSGGGAGATATTTTTTTVTTHPPE